MTPSFVQVQVVSEKSTGDVYAMKVMKKTHILQQPDASWLFVSTTIVHVNILHCVPKPQC